MMVDARKALQNGKAARKHFPKHVTQPITNVQAVRRSYRDAGIPEDEWPVNPGQTAQSWFKIASVQEAIDAAIDLENRQDRIRLLHGKKRAHEIILDSNSDRTTLDAVRTLQGMVDATKSTPDGKGSIEVTVVDDNPAAQIPEG